MKAEQQWAFCTTSRASSSMGFATFASVFQWPFRLMETERTVCVCMRSAYSLSTLARTHTTGRVYIYTHTYIYTRGKKIDRNIRTEHGPAPCRKLFKKDEGLVDFCNLFYSWHLAVFDHVILILFRWQLDPIIYREFNIIGDSSFLSLKCNQLVLFFHRTDDPWLMLMES